jgi:hypothetical protein
MAEVGEITDQKNCVVKEIKVRLVMKYHGRARLRLTPINPESSIDGGT